jgi:hypothetical protein
VDASSEWPEPERRVLVDTVSASHAVCRPQATIRQWAYNGHLTKHGEDAKGRSLYDLAEVYAVSQRMAGKKGGK